MPPGPPSPSIRREQVAEYPATGGCLSTVQQRLGCGHARLKAGKQRRGGRGRGEASTTSLPPPTAAAAASAGAAAAAGAWGKAEAEAKGSSVDGGGWRRRRRARFLGARRPHGGLHLRAFKGATRHRQREHMFRRRSEFGDAHRRNDHWEVHDRRARGQQRGEVVLRGWVVHRRISASHGVDGGELLGRRLPLRGDPRGLACRRLPLSLGCAAAAGPLSALPAAAPVPAA
mmetsp:Transcript_24448/g.60862  ORF Transcript_24448/g.60862 Transcript_24448/m.60862 type:complete len:230 (-) Transcript_24448:994-1683(-)